MAGSEVRGAFVEQGGSIDTREELVGALAVAAELEHALLAQYLFAGYSIKKRPTEGINLAQVELCRSWEAVLLDVARQEMAHLATVTNLSTAVGGTPHFNRPSFPQAPGAYYPFEMRLERFGPEAIGRFVRFETPADAAAFAPQGIAPDPIEFTFLGDLYGQIDQGLVTIADSLGEEQLFIGPPSAQDTDDWGLRLVIHGVRDLATARAAIADVVRQGEGSAENREGSHWDRFRLIQDQLDAEMAASPGFDPARNVVANPATRAHPDAGSGATILRPGSLALAVAELFNHLYSTVLGMLAQFYAFAGESPAQRAGLQAGSRRAMSAILRPLAEVLTELPVDGRPAAGVGVQSDDGPRAGAGFETYALVELPGNLAARWVMLDERLDRAATECRSLANEPELGRLVFLAENIGLLLGAVRQLAQGEGSETIAGPRV